MRVLFFWFSEGYAAAEVWYFLANYFRNGLNPFVLYGGVFGLLLAVGWIVFDRVEGLIASAFLVGLPFLPAVYFVNKKFFPGRYDPISLVGNGVLAVLMAVLVLFLFVRYLKNFHLLADLNHRSIFAVSFVIVVSINLAYFFQPEVKRLAPAPSEPGDLIHFMNKHAVNDVAGSDNTPGGAEERMQRHFSEVVRGRRASVVAKIRQRNRAEIFQIADAALRGEFTFLNVTRKLDTPIEWHRNPTDDREWLLSLNRLDWMWELAAAYELTRDKKYAEVFELYMTSWFAQNPVPPWKDESGNVWRLIESSARITDSWLDAFVVFFNSTDVTPTLKWRMLAAFHDHAQFLAHFRSPRRNHLLQETYGLLAVAAAFPEFSMAADWLDIAKFRLDRALRTDVYPDGGYNEGSIYYHRFAVRILQQIADCAATYEVRLSDLFYEQLERMYAFLLYTSRPDGVMPQMNDGFHAKNLRPLFEKPASMFSRPDFEYFASGGKLGRRPASTSKAFPFSGIYVMRSDWAADARYMIIDAGPYGSAHGHEDKLSFELFAYGKPFIVEGGTFTYVPGPWRRFFTSSFAHNTVVVDGKSQMRAFDEHSWLNEPPVKLPNTWLSDESFDFLEASYDKAYGNIKEAAMSGLKHTRRVLFVKPDYWLIWDVVDGHGEHTVQQLFHGAPACSVRAANATMCEVIYDDSDVGLELLPLSEQPLTVQSLRGKEKPIQGWISPTYGVKLPATTISVTAAGSLPLVLASVLFPWQSANPDLDAELLPVLVNGNVESNHNALAIRINSQTSTDFVLIAPDVEGQKSFAGTSTDAEICLIRQFLDGTELRRELSSALEQQK